MPAAAPRSRRRWPESSAWHGWIAGAEGGASWARSSLLLTDSFLADSFHTDRGRLGQARETRINDQLLSGERLGVQQELDVTADYGEFQPSPFTAKPGGTARQQHRQVAVLVDELETVVLGQRIGKQQNLAILQVRNSLEMFHSDLLAGDRSLLGHPLNLIQIRLAADNSYIDHRGALALWLTFRAGPPDKKSRGKQNLESGFRQ